MHNLAFSKRITIVCRCESVQTKPANFYSTIQKCVTCNCRGWNSGPCVLPDLLDACDICFIQEHWLFTEHLSDLNSVNNEFTFVGVSGMDSGILLCGRPYGGCGIIYCKSLFFSYVKTLHTGSNHFCSIKLCDSVGTSFLLIYVYLPTVFQSSSFTDYLNTLGELEGFIDSQSFDHILISGDFNVDFDRGGDNACTTVMEFYG